MHVFCMETSKKTYCYCLQEGAKLNILSLNKIVKYRARQKIEYHKKATYIDKKD